jgi:ketol-acid reductoisomerase
MKSILKDVQSGKFAREWIKEIRSGGKKFKAMEKAEAKHPIEKIGKKLRKNMKWIDAK